MYVGSEPHDRRRTKPAVIQNITTYMQNALQDQLKDKSCVDRKEIASYLQDEFDVEVSVSSVIRTMQSMGWSEKITRRVAKQRNSVLRHLYHYKLSKYKSYHLVFIDESGCDSLTAQRRKGWAPI